MGTPYSCGNSLNVQPGIVPYEHSKCYVSCLAVKVPGGLAAFCKVIHELNPQLIGGTIKARIAKEVLCIEEKEKGLSLRLCSQTLENRRLYNKQKLSRAELHCLKYKHFSVGSTQNLVDATIWCTKSAYSILYIIASIKFCVLPTKGFFFFK